MTSPRSRTVALPACCICDRRCIPLADYDRPVCFRCDELAEQTLAIAGAVDVLVTSPAPAAPAEVEPIDLKPAQPSLFDEIRANLRDHERRTA